MQSKWRVTDFVTLGSPLAHADILLARDRVGLEAKQNDREFPDLSTRDREEFPWKKYKTFIDIGGPQGYVPVEVAFAHPHLSGAEFDLSRLTFTPGGFFKDPLPSSDVLIMGTSFTTGTSTRSSRSFKKAHDALPRWEER